MEGGVNPYKVLEVLPGFGLEELKNNYKRIALKVHPERGGNEYMLNIVTECFKKLMREYKRRSQGTVPNADSPSSNQRFNLDKFNKIFEDNKVDDIYDKGYGDWYMKANIKEPPKFKGKSMEAFNRHFERHVEGAPSKNAEVPEEPEAFGASKLEWTELGAQSVKDFSGDNSTMKRLNFSDLMIAHSTSRIIDPSSVNRKEYQSVDELKRDRGNISFTMEEEEAHILRKREAERQEAERKRRENLAKRDMIAEQHYNKVHEVMQRTLR